MDVGAVLLDQLHKGGSLGDEHTGVPAVLTRGDVLGGGVGVGLLLEGVDNAGAGGGLDGQLLAELHVTEAGGRVRRRDTNSNEVTFLGDVDGLSDGAEESLLTGNHVIGGERTDDGLGVALGENGGSQTNGSHRVLGSGLGEQVGAFELRELALDGVGVGRAGDDGHARGTGEGHQTVPGGLEQRAARQVDVEEELGVVLARQGPETGTGATSGDDDVEAGDLKLGRGVERQLGAGGAHGGELGGRVDARQLGRANKGRVVVGSAAEAEVGEGVVAAVLGVLLKEALEGGIELKMRHRIY